MQVHSPARGNYVAWKVEGKKSEKMIFEVVLTNLSDFNSKVLYKCYDLPQGSLLFLNVSTSLLQSTAKVIFVMMMF